MIDQIKNQFLYHVLKEFQTYMDDNGNFQSASWDEISEGLISKGVMTKEKMPMLRRVITSMGSFSFLGDLGIAPDSSKLLDHDNGSVYRLTDVGNLVS